MKIYGNLLGAVSSTSTARDSGLQLVESACPVRCIDGEDSCSFEVGWSVIGQRGEPIQGITHTEDC
jgi:hypothetical protein